MEHFNFPLKGDLKNTKETSPISRRDNLGFIISSSETLPHLFPAPLYSACRDKAQAFGKFLTSYLTFVKNHKAMRLEIL